MSTSTDLLTSEILRLVATPEFKLALEKALSTEYAPGSPMADDRFLKAKTLALIDGTRQVITEAQKLQFGQRQGAVSVYYYFELARLSLHLQRPGMTLYHDFTLDEAKELHTELGKKIIQAEKADTDLNTFMETDAKTSG